MGHSKDLGLLAGHSKDVGDLDPRARGEIVRSVVDAWGPITVPALLQAPLPALIGQAVAALGALAASGALSVDESSELHGRIGAVTVLASAPDESSPHRPIEASGSLFDVLATTLPDPSLAGSWDVGATAAAATAAVIGQAISAEDGGESAAARVISAWPAWVRAGA